MFINYQNSHQRYLELPTRITTHLFSFPEQYDYGASQKGVPVKTDDLKK